MPSILRLYRRVTRLPLGDRLFSFVFARKAHPAFVLDTVAELEDAANRLAHAGHEVDWSQRATFAGYERFHAFDGHGNRVEVLTPA